MQPNGFLYEEKIKLQIHFVKIEKSDNETK